MQAITVDKNMIQFQQGMASFMNLFNVDVQQKQVDLAAKLYAKLNKEMSKADFDGTTPEEAASKLQLAKAFYTTLNTVLIAFEESPKIKTKYKKQLLPILKETVQHWEEMIEAFEIYADSDAMGELGEYLKRSA